MALTVVASVALGAIGLVIVHVSAAMKATPNAKCANYTQLSDGGGAYIFTGVKASGTSCKTAQTVLEIFANTTTGHQVAGFTCSRRPAGKRHSANCVRKSAAVTFTYLAPT